MNGQTIAVNVRVHVMTAHAGLPGRLELDVGDELSPIPGLPNGHLRVLWDSVETNVPDPPHGRYALGGVVLLVLLARMWWLDRRDGVSRPS